MTSHEEFFREKKPAAVLKHGVLSNYVKVFTTMLGSRSEAVWVIDAYAGPGEYASDSDTPAEPGSPKILCDVANSVGNTVVRGAFIEPRAEHVAQLRQLIAQHSQPGRHAVYEGEAQQHLKTAVAAAGTAPLLIFLDPFGAAVSLDTIVDAVKGRPRWAITEILLNFNVESVWRIGGYLTSAHPGLAESEALRVVDDFVGGSWWRQVFLDARGADGSGSAADAAQAVAERFNTLIHQKLGLDAVTVPIRRRPNNKPIFLLTLYFRDDTAAWVFADAASGANAYLRKHLKRVDDAELPTDTLFSLEELQGQSDADFERREKALDDEWIGLIVDNLRDLVARVPELCLKRHTFDVYGTTLGLARERHVRAAWDRLAADGWVEPRDTKGRLRNGIVRRRSPSAG